MTTKHQLLSFAVAAAEAASLAQQERIRDQNRRLERFGTGKAQRTIGTNRKVQRELNKVIGARQAKRLMKEARRAKT